MTVEMPSLHRRVAAAQRIRMLKIPNLRNAVLLVPRMLGATFGAAVEVFYLTGEDGWPSEPDAGERSEPVVGQIAWNAASGDRVQHTLRVKRAKNAALGQREVTIRPEPFKGTDVAPEVDVVSRALAVGESFDCVVSLTVPDSLAGGNYVGNIVVEGDRAERVIIELTVKPRQQAVTFIEQR
jgi:hypothetical protein